jgi:hypothetical protein
MLQGLPRELAHLVEGAAPDDRVAPAAPGKGTRVPAVAGAAAPPSAAERVKAYAGETVRSAAGEYVVSAEGGFAPRAGAAAAITRTSDPEAYAHLAAILFLRPPARASTPAAPPGLTAAPPPPPPSLSCEPAPAAAPIPTGAGGEHDTVRAVNAAWALRDAGTPTAPGSASVDARPSATRAVSHAISRDRPAAMSAGELHDLENRLIAAFEDRAFAIAHAQLDANERIARAEAGRYGELSSGDPTTDANQLRTAATALGAVQTQILDHIAAVNAAQPYGAPRAYVTATNLDDYLDAPILQTDPAYRALRLSYDTLRRIYGPAFPVLLHRNTDYNAIATADPARLAELVAGATGDVLTKIVKTRAQLTRDKTWSLAPVVELTKHAMGLQTSCPALVVIERHKAGRDQDAAFVNLALGALGLVIALAGIAVTVGSGGAGAPVGAAALASAEAMSSVALVGAGFGVVTAIEQYAEYDFKHAAAGASLDPVTALSAEDPSLAWLIVAIAGACLDVGAAIVAFRNLAAIARVVKTLDELAALERAAVAQAAVLKQQGKLAGTDQEFVQRVMRSAETKLATKGRKPPLAGALDDEVAAAEKAYAEANKKPMAILPSGREIPPQTYGGGYHCPREQIPPDVAFVDGLPARGTDMRLREHAMPGSELASGEGSGFRGTTPEPVAPNDAAEANQGAVYWGDVGDWVYEIRGVPTWDLEQALQGQIRLPDGSHGGKLLTVSELEGAIPSRVPGANIVRGGQIGVLQSGRKYVPHWIPNPNYKPRTP